MRKSALIAAVAVILTSCTSDGNKNIDTEITETNDSVSTLLTDSVHDMVEDTDSMSVREKEFAVMRTDSLSVGGATLYVRSNSMKSNLKLSITPLSKNQLPEMPSGMVNVTGKYAGYRFLPHGEHFTGCDATLAIPYDTLKIPDGYRESDIATYFYNEKTKRWQELKKERIDKGKSLAYASTSHFTDVVNAILKVPESPETGALTPTFISDYEPANPAAGIYTMEAPTPNANGTANMSYVFNLPQGRAGMTPSLALQYNSDGGSGPEGYGFSLPIEKIEIDTRWGCPTFDETIESESYLLNGEQFTLKAHNHDNIKPEARTGGDKEFHLRIDGNSLIIVRHGSSTKDYYWTVTDKDGTVKTFTGYDGISDSPDYNHTGSENNLIEWVLTKVCDRHGNTIKYKYTSQTGTLYLSKIHYTGYEGNNDDGIHTIDFSYKKPTYRCDPTLSYRLGVKQANNTNLSNVFVITNGDTLRSYALEYSTSNDSIPFKKTLLKYVTERDRKGDTIGVHKFDYYNDINDILFEKEESLSVFSNGLSDKPFFAAYKSFKPDRTALGSSYSKGYSVGGGLHAGFGYNHFINVYAGASYQYSYNNNESRTIMTDINGDGLPDILFADSNDTIKYMPNLGIANPDETDRKYDFGPARNIKTMPGKLSEGESESHNLIADMGAQVFFFGGSASYSHTWQNSANLVYLQDFNADGLIDIGYKGVVWFNHIDENGNPVFTESSQPTPCPIPGLRVKIAEEFQIDEEAKQKEMTERFPRHDVVRVWRAPYDGTIKIGAEKITVSKNSADGVTASIQIGKTVKWKSETDSDYKINSGGSITTPELSETVKRGDKIYFRLQSFMDAVGDSVQWNPSIEYTSTLNNKTIEDDENGSMKRYNASEQFLFCDVSNVPLAKLGKIRITAPFTKKRLSDEVCLIVRKICYPDGENFDENDPYSEEYTDIERRYLRAAEEYNNEPMEIFLTVTQKDIDDNAYLKFIIESHSQINWENITWEPACYSNDEPVPFIYVAPHLTMYNNHIKIAEGNKTKKGEYIVKPNFSLITDTGNNTNRDFNVNFSLKDDKGNVYYSGPYKESMSIPVSLSEDATLYGSFHCDDELKQDTIKAATYFIDGERREAAVFSTFNRNDFGHLYRGWGQFAYNGEENPDDAIDENLLHIEYTDKQNSLDKLGLYQLKDEKPRKLKKSIKNGGIKIEEEQLKNSEIDDISKQKFFTMTLIPNHRRYESVARESFISRDGASSSRIGRQDMNVAKPTYPEIQSDDVNPENDRTACPMLTVTGESNGFSGGASLIIGVGGGVSKTKSYSQTAINDINGDGYPDWLSADEGSVNVHFTNSNGQLTDNVLNYSCNPSNSTSEAKTLSVDAGFSCSDPSIISAIGVKENWSMQQSNKSSNENAKSSVSASISGNFCEDEASSDRDWIDINGDGLPDIVKKGKVWYNNGNGFEKGVEYTGNFEAAYKTSSFTTGAGLGISVSICGKASIGGGLSMSSSNNTTDIFWRDLNADGLPDLIENGKIMFNTGNNLTEVKNMNMTDKNTSTSTSASISGNVAAPIYITPTPVYITPSVSFSGCDGVSRTDKLIVDFDGDGYPDIMESDGSSVSVKRSKIRRTNKLKSVTNPLGGKIELDYAPAKHTYGMPNARWVMTSVEISGGSEELGATSTKDTISYYGGFYNRCERTFIGFDSIKVTSLDTESKEDVKKPLRTVKTTYLTNSIYTKGLPSLTETLDSDGKTLYGVKYEYTLMGDSVSGGKGVFPAKTKETTIWYGDGTNLSKVRTFDYDTLCNLTKYTVDDDLNAEIEYHESDIVRNAVKSIKAGDLLERRSEIDEKGDITKLIVSTDSDDAVYDMEYDGYGNLTKITRPANEKGERAWTAVKYDNVTHSLPVEVSDSYGLKSTTEYHKLFMLPVKTTDANGAVVKYTYDNMGRVTSVTAPQEVESSKSTLSFTYDVENLTATTTHHTPEGEFEVITAIDPLGRTLYAKRPSAIYASGKPEVKRVRTGKCKYDALGRKVKEYKAYLEDDDPVVLRSTEYDALDRPVKTTLSNGAVTETSYVVESNDIAGGTVLNATVTDPRGNKSSQMTDGRGRTVATVRYKNGSEHDNIVVKTEYDALNRPVKVTHPNGGSSTYVYDKAGNITTYTSPDAGTVTMKYTPQGQVLERTTPTGVIKYEYDFERLQKTTSTSNADNALTNEVFYLYGNADDKDGYNRGRLIYVKDGSGATALSYGSMGEVVKTVRRIIVNPDPEHLQTHAFVSESEYDSWGRILSMTYPDGEVVKYGYHSGTGELASVKNDDNAYIYISDIAYATGGQTAMRQMGDGTVETFTYDDLDRLQTSTLASGETVLSSNTYSYDKADNITQIFGSQNSYEQQYEYDEFNRLIHATGKGPGILNGGKDCIYDVSYTYNIMSGFDKVSKNIQKYDELSGKNVSIDEKNAYIYGWDEESGRTAPTKIGEIDYNTYDASGNPAEISGEELHRSLVWDCENRLRLIDDGDRLHIYTYDHTGERALKRYGNKTNVGVDAGESQSVIEEAEGYSAYFSPYFVETNNGRYSKHYYAGTQRMASRVEYLPKGMGEEPQQPEQAEQPDSQEQASEMASGQPSKEEKEAMREYQKLQQMEVAKVEASGESESASGTEESEAVEPDLYYYHTDHLGSTTFITDRDGNVAQYLAYTPYGETFIEERDVTPYKFNGKELDAETGLYYYGARYYDPTTALWLGVDPLAEKYPDVSPYVYCAGNPVKYVDPDGREKIISFYTDGNATKTESQRSKDNRVIMESANKYYDNPNSVAVWAHGSDNGNTMVMFDGSKDGKISQYYYFDRFLSKNSDVYVNNSAEQKTTLVILHSCETGKENGFAQNMSEKLNILVVAPTENVSVDRKTSNEIGVNNNGGWNVFYRGKKMDSFSGTTQPIFKNPEQIIDKYVQKYERLYNKEE